MNPNQKHTDWRVHLVLNVKNNKMLVVPMSTSNKYRYGYQKTYKSKSNGLLKPSYLALDKVYWYQLTKYNTVQNYSKYVGQMTNEEYYWVKNELQLYWESNPDTKKQLLDG
jgi:hypothetical protein